jgi:hypothetical protein
MTLPVPGPVTTGIALSGLSKMTRDLIAVSGSIWGLARRRKDRQAAKNLYAIAFKPGGMLDLLQKIVDGEGTMETIKGLDQELRYSIISIGRHISGIERYSHVYREKFGFSAGIDLTYLVGLKSDVRDDIREVVEYYETDKAKSRKRAKRTVCLILTLNQQIADAHDRILSISRSSKEVALSTPKAKPKRRMTKASDDAGGSSSPRGRGRPPKVIA